MNKITKFFKSNKINTTLSNEESNEESNSDTGSDSNSNSNSYSESNENIEEKKKDLDILIESDITISLHSIKENKLYDAKIVSAYDGDTCMCNILLPSKEIVRRNIRLYGYDSPEMRPKKDKIMNVQKDLERRNEIKKNAMKARNRFIELTTDQKIDKNKKYSKNELKELFNNNKKLIKIECHGWGKYGRLLGTIYINNKSINQIMINEEHGKPYYGGTKS
jgi:endonuclease YncB( thermonuclease family)